MNRDRLAVMLLPRLDHFRVQQEISRRISRPLQALRLFKETYSEEWLTEQHACRAAAVVRASVCTPGSGLNILTLLSKKVVAVRDEQDRECRATLVLVIRHRGTVQQFGGIDVRQLVYPFAVSHARIVSARSVLLNQKEKRKGIRL